MTEFSIIFPRHYQVEVWAPGQVQIILVQEQTFKSVEWREHYDRVVTEKLYGNMPIYKEGWQ